MRENEAANAFAVSCAPVEASADIGADPLLSALENQRPHFFMGCTLLFEALVQIRLSLVELERNIASSWVFGANFEAARRVMCEVISEFLADRASALTQVAQGHPRVCGGANPFRR